MKTEDIYTHCLEKLHLYLDEHNLHHTPERETILKQIVEHHCVFCPKELQEWLTEAHISRATVYNTLELLCSARILHALKQQINTKQVQYELTLARTNHIQMICPRCGRVSEVKDTAIRNLVLTKKYSNFVPQHFSLYVYGECKVCRKRKINN